MKELEMIIAKETKRGTRYYKMYRHNMMPIKKAVVEEMMAEGLVELVDGDYNVIWSPAVEEVVVEAEAEEVDGTVLDATGTDYNDMNVLKERFIGNFEQLPAEIQNFIMGCDWFNFDGNSLLLYKGRKAVAEGCFYVENGKIYLDSIGAGEVFQWSRIQCEAMAEALADKVNNMVCEGFTAEEITKAVDDGTDKFGKDFTYYLDYGIREIARRFKEENTVAIINIEGVEVGVRNIPELLEKVDLSEMKLDRTVNEGMKAYILERAENNFNLALRNNPELVRLNFYKTYLRYTATLQNLDNKKKRE